MDTAIRTVKSDTKGNRLCVQGDYIYLDLISGKSKERLARIDLEKKRLEIHLEFLDFNERFKCYPFNECLLRTAQKCETVYIIAPEGRFCIPIRELLEYGTPLIYGTNDLSNQLYVNISLIKKYPAT